ncbi:TPA: restriction endonuclease subunit S [Pseudomonas aeruginosa]|nr:restriction endonuclease subunit S [Pseudomonas aeruginosa]
MKEVAKVVTGKTPSTVDDQNFGGDIPFVTPAELGLDTYVTSAPRTLSAKGASAIKLVPENAVMVCCIGSLGKMAIAGTPVATNQQINSVIFDENRVDVKYGFYALQLLKPKMEAMAPSTTVAIVNKGNFEAMQIPLPPLVEQKRIAAILDKADAIRRKRQQAIQLADDFLRAVFLDMFGDPVTNSKGFPIGTIRDLVATADYGSSAKASETYGEYPILRMGNITYQGRIDLEGLKYINLEEKERSKYLVEKGDLLFNRTNSKELVGKTAVYDMDDPVAIAGYLIRVRPNEMGNSHYISGYLNSAHGKATLRSICKSIVGMANINAQEMQNIPIMLPSIELQRKYQELVVVTKCKLQVFDTALKLTEQLFSSLSYKAFSGQL